MKEFVVLHFIDPNTNELYLLKKDKPSMPHLHNKLVGFGGKIEENETPHEALIREIKEELDLEINEEDLILRGVLYDAFNAKVFVFTSFLNKRKKDN